MSLLTERNYGPKAGIGQHRMPTTAPPVSIPASAQLWETRRRLRRWMSKRRTGIPDRVSTSPPRSGS